MDKKGYRHIPQAFLQAITFLAQVLPKRSVHTWLELLFGALLTQSGFVTDAYLAIAARRHWTSYYKWLQQGKWSWVALGMQTARLALQQINGTRCFLVIDDTVVYRSSRKAPESRIHHQHGQKTNRPLYVRGQNWVSMAMSISKQCRPLAVPVLSRLVRATGNTTRITAAKTLLRVTRSVFAQHNATVLLDSWYMRKTLILPAQKMGYHVIGQVRRNTALFETPPPPTGKRGRPRKYGPKIVEEHVITFPQSCEDFTVYGKQTQVLFRSKIVLARFLNGLPVRVVWVQFVGDNGVAGQQRLLLSTDLSLSAEEIIQAYSRRWPIEDMFNQLKNRWGVKETWQQSRQVLHRWMQIISTSYALPQILAHHGCKDVQALAEISPWRKNQPVTAGRVRQGLDTIFRKVDIRALWDPKSRKFGSQLQKKGRNRALE